MPDRRSLWFAVALLGAAALVFGVALPNPYYFDDVFILKRNAWLAPGFPLHRWLWATFADSAQTFPAYRPFLMISYALNVRAFGSSPEAFRAVNLLIHVANAWLLARIFLVLFRDRSAAWVAWGGAFLFLLHPIQTLPINFLWKRSELLQVFFVLAGLALHVTERARGDIYRRRVMAIEVALLSLAVATKESGIILPALMFVADLCFFRKRKELLSIRSILLYGGLLSASALYLWFRLEVVGGWVSAHHGFAPDRRYVGGAEYLRASLDVIPKYLSLWLAPRPLLLDDPSPLRSFPWLGATATGLMLGVTVLLSVRFRRQPVIPFSLGLFWIGLAPTTGLRPLLLVMDQIRLYLPLAGLSMILALSLATLATRIGLRPVLFLTAVGVLYGGTSFLQNLRYGNQALIWQDVTEAYPHSGMAWDAYGGTLARFGRYEQAVRAFDEAARVEPTNPSFRVYPLLSRLESASPAERKRKLDAIRTEELDARILINLAMWEAAHREEARAADLLLKVIGRFPNLSQAHHKLGIVWEGMKNLEGARRAYANALALDPDDSEIRKAAERLGRPSAP